MGKRCLLAIGVGLVLFGVLPEASGGGGGGTMYTIIGKTVYMGKVVGNVTVRAYCYGSGSQGNCIGCTEQPSDPVTGSFSITLDTSGCCCCDTGSTILLTFQRANTPSPEYQHSYAPNVGSVGSVSVPPGTGLRPPPKDRK
jgi:hypothetical protein